MVPSTPRSLVKFRPSALFGQYQGVQLHSDQGPGARRDVSGIAVPGCTQNLGGDGGDGRGSVVRAHSHHRSVSRQTRLLKDRRKQRAHGFSGLDELREDVSGQAQRVQELRGPFAGQGVEQPGGGGIGSLRAANTGEQEPDQVRNQEGLQPFQIRFCSELVDRVHLKLAVSGLILSVVLASSAQAQVTIDVSKITCDQYVHSKIATPNLIAAWLSGYYNAKRDNRVIDPEDMQNGVSRLQHYCYEEKNFKTPVMKAVEELFDKKK